VEKTNEALYKKQSTAAFKSATERLVGSLFAKVRQTQHSILIFRLPLGRKIPSEISLISEVFFLDFTTILIGLSPSLMLLRCFS